MIGHRAIFAASLTLVLALGGCGADNERPQDEDDEISIGEQLAPPDDDYGVGSRDDTTPLPGTRPADEENEDQTELRDRIPPDGA